MGNTAGDKLRQAVSAVRDRAAAAEREFDRRADALERKTRQSMDIFGDDTLSRVADIAAESRKICDSLYAAYQTLVVMLDEQCRPLLAENPDYIAVREVSRTIAWLNEESEIENNFTASFEGMGLGDIAARRYFPSMESKMTESFWETKLAMWPGREEAEAQERRQKEEAEQQRRKQAEQAAAREKEELRQEKLRYAREYEAWQAKTAEIEKQRADEVGAALARSREQLLHSLEETYSNAQKTAAHRKASCIQRREQAEARLSTLGAFSFSEKSALRKTIKELDAELRNAEAELVRAEESYAGEKAALQSRLESERILQQRKAEHKYPLPERPMKPFFLKADGSTLSVRELENQSLARNVLKFMAGGGQYSIMGILEEMPRSAYYLPLDVTPQRLSAILTSLVNAGRIKRIMGNREVFFEYDKAGDKPDADTADTAATSSPAAAAPRPAASRPASPRQLENEKIKMLILANMRPGEVYDITDILRFSDVAVYDCTPQRVGSMMTQLVAGEKVCRSVNGTTVLYSLIV